MSVVDLCRRATADWDDFNRYVRSSDSLIFFEGTMPIVSDPPGSIDLCVGSQWYDPANDRYYSVEDGGLEIRPQSCAIIEVDRRIALPHNVMGLVTGKGHFIFQSALISTGKVDPGFDGHLRIGFFNASKKTIPLRRDAPFCTCFFFNTESEAKNPRRNEARPRPQASPIPRWMVAKRLAAEKWDRIIPIAISLVSLTVAIISLTTKR